MSDGGGTDAVVEGRRTTDMAAAIAIAEMRVELRSLTQTMRDSYAMLTVSVESIKSEQVSTASSVRYEVKSSILDLKKELIEDLREHTHNDLAPHQASLGKRIISLETSRTYQRGAIAVATLLIPILSALLVKWIGG